MVNGLTCRENHGSEIVDIDFLLTELAGRKAFYFDKGTEHYFHAVFTRYIVIRRLIGSGLGLRYKNFIYFHDAVTR